MIIQAKSPGSAPKSLSDAPPLPLNLGGGGGMVIPTMRVTSTGATAGLDTLAVTNSGKLVYERDGLEDLNPTFGRFTASNFASHVDCGEITGNMYDRDSTLYHQDEYSRNVASLGGGVFEGSIGLAGSTSAFEKPNLHNRKALFDPSRFTKFKKLPVIYTIVTRLLLSPGAIGEVYCGGKIGPGQNLQTCVASVIPG